MKPLKNPHITTTIAILAVAAATLLPSCASKPIDPFDLALNQTIARMTSDMGKEDAQ